MDCDKDECRRMGVIIPDECVQFNCSRYTKYLENTIAAVRSVVDKHRRAVAEPYLIPGGSKEVARSFFEDIERVLSD